METLGQLTEGKLPKGRVDRKSKVLQFGEGNFLRAFVDWMIYEMNAKAEFNAAVTVVQPIEHGLVDKLNAQDGLYNVYLNGIQKGEFVSSRVLVDVINDSINPYTDFDSYMGQALNPDLEFIISNTTEAGIQFNSSDRFEGEPAASFPAKLTQLLYKRYQKLPDSGKLYFLPCELINKNGEKLKEAIFQYIDHWGLGQEFKNWLSQKTIFYNTLVDRIVPGYPKERAEKYWDELGYKDELIVEGEIFHLWVIEGPNKIKEMLPVEKAGLNVVFTDDLEYYRTRKVRILNGAHTSMVPVAYLYGLDFVKEAVENELIGSFTERVVFDEIIPSLDGDKNELRDYAGEIIDRFKNPAIKHELISISLNSFSKFKTRVLPSILGFYEKEQKLPQLLLTSFASLIYFYKGKRFEKAIPLKDEKEILELMRSLWDGWDGSEDGISEIVSSVLSNESLWSKDLTTIPGMVEFVTGKVIKIQEQGIGKALM